MKLPGRFLAKMNQVASGEIFVIVTAGLKSLYLHSPALEKMLHQDVV